MGRHTRIKRTPGAIVKKGLHPDQLPTDLGQLARDLGVPYGRSAPRPSPQPTPPPKTRSMQAAPITEKVTPRKFAEPEDSVRVRHALGRRVLAPNLTSIQRQLFLAGKERSISIGRLPKPILYYAAYGELSCRSQWRIDPTQAYAMLVSSMIASSVEADWEQLERPISVWPDPEHSPGLQLIETKAIGESSHKFSPICVVARSTAAQLVQERHNVRTALKLPTDVLPADAIEIPIARVRPHHAEVVSEILASLDVLSSEVELGPLQPGPLNESHQLQNMSTT